MGHRQKKKLPSSVLLLLWPGEVRRKREGDSGQTGPALFAGSNKTELGKFFFLPMPHIWHTSQKISSIAVQIIYALNFTMGGVEMR